MGNPNPAGKDFKGRMEDMAASFDAPREKMLTVFIEQATPMNKGPRA